MSRLLLILCSCDTIPASSASNISNEVSLMAYVVLREGESPEAIVGRFRSAVARSGVLKAYKDKRFFRSKGEKERMAAQRAERRRRRRTI